MILIAALFTAQAALTEKAYERAVNLVEGLYLYPDDVDAHAMLRESADSVATRVHWLMVETQGNAVNLRHGDGTQIGSVSVANLETLPSALLSLEQLVTQAGHPIDDDVDVRLLVLKGMTRALDRYSRVLSGDGLDRFDVRLKGTLVGVGLTIRIEDDKLMVTRVTSGGPADLGGVQVGDHLTRIDGRSTVNMPTREATRRIRGEKGSQVVFTVRRGEVTLELKLERDEIVVPNVESRVLDGDVGLVRITHVSQRTVDNLLGEIESLKGQGALEHGLIVDLRGNTGGSMKESARAVDEFVDAGMLLRTAGHDGGRVRNLQARMDAVEGGLLRELPVVVLIDERTASGAEIIAGSLLELDRAALVGTRSYGKGTVQKIYPLDEGARLKLTVAQYLLEHDRVIADVGIVPDVVVGEVTMDSFGVHFDGFDEERNRTARADIVPWVRERWSWRQEDVEEQNLVEELARLALLDDVGLARERLVASLQKHAQSLEVAEWAHFDEALAVKGIDWSPAEVPLGALPDLQVTLTQDRPEGTTDVMRVTAALENRGEVPIHQASVELTSDFSAWDGLVLPVGRVEPGATVTGEVEVALNAGVNPREDRVFTSVRVEGLPPRSIGESALKSVSSVEPRLRGRVRWVKENEGAKAVVVLHNQSAEDLEGVEVHFGYPGDVDVELIDRAARVPRIGAGAEHTFELGVKVGDSAPDVLPMRLVVESPRYGKLETWPLDLPLDGAEVRLEPPRVAALVHPANAPVGPFTFKARVTDDRAVDHIVLYRNGEKVAWAPGADKAAELEASVSLEVGVNRLLVVTEDDQGLAGREQFVVRGVPSDAAVEAHDP